MKKEMLIFIVEAALIKTRFLLKHSTEKISDELEKCCVCCVRCVFADSALVVLHTYTQHCTAKEHPPCKNFRDI